MKTRQVLGVFKELDAIVQAIHDTRDAGYALVTTYAPLPSHEIEHATGGGRSGVRVFTLVGGSAGAIGGMALAVWTSVRWGLITGGKPIVSIPPFLIISFELALLIGALSTVVGLFVMSRLPRFGGDPMYDPRFSVDRFGLVVACDEGSLEKARAMLLSAGAEEVRLGEG